MPHLIIGHTDSDSVRVWVKGDASSTTCEVTLRPAPPEQPAVVQLGPGSDYTAIVVIPNLKSDVDYDVVAVFSPSGARERGRARTFKKLPVPVAAVSFSFVLSSCNLSIVSINDFLARMAATAGAALASSSLDIAPYRWHRPKSRGLQWVARWVGQLALKLVAGSIQRATGIKQTGSTYLRSPFLKLAAIFESCVVELPLPAKPGLKDAAREPAASHRNRLFVAVGDRVCSQDATGVIASMRDDDEKGLRQLVITHVEGTFKPSAELFRQVTENRTTSLRRLDRISGVRAGRAWYEPPSFFIHAGDQIYYDFPDPDRAPKRDAYRLAYHEAWFEDDSLRHLLGHWPHYMTLDDHEIADQYARDFHPPKPLNVPDTYLHQSVPAYREYAHALNPPGPGGQAREDGPFWFTFDKGATQFFVMDTRTQRYNDRGDKTGEIIDADQMRAFLAWLGEHRTALKFVVTSVPFVAELNRRAAGHSPDWYDGQRNSEQDKWTAPQFAAQRDAIIEHIHRRRIEHLVFLTGDMHCCYHATLRIGHGETRYQSTVVHELAGGPVNQLQLARAADFQHHRRARTSGQVDYEVTLERFHGDVSAVMHLTVDYVTSQRVARAASSGDHADAVVPEVEWNVIRTLTDPGPEGWLEGAASEPVMSGRISFVRRRTPEELATWP